MYSIYPIIPSIYHVLRDVRVCRYSLNSCYEGMLMMMQMEKQKHDVDVM